MMPNALNVSFHRNFTAVLNALQDVGFSQMEMDGIYACLAAILHLGNVTFDAVYDDIDPATISSHPQVLKMGGLG